MTLQTHHEHLDDATLLKLQNELVDFASLQARQHAEQKTQLTETQYRFGFLEVVGKRVQKVVYEKLSKILAVSTMVAVQHLKKENDKKIELLKATKNHCEHQLLDITHHPNYEKKVVAKKSKMPTWMWVVVAFFAIAEGFFIYQGMLLTGMGLVTSCLTFISVATGIIIGSDYIARYIKKILSTKARVLAIISTHVVVFIAFYVLAKLRVDAIKASVARSVDQNNYATVPPNSLPITLAFISTFIFLLGFLCAYHHAKTTKEIAVLDLLDKEREIVQKNKALDVQIEAIENETKEKSKAALAQYENALLYLKQLKSIASIANAKYVSTYINFKSGDAIPAFLQVEPDFRIEDFIPKQ